MKTAPFENNLSSTITHKNHNTEVFSLFTQKPNCLGTPLYLRLAIVLLFTIYCSPAASVASGLENGQEVLKELHAIELNTIRILNALYVYREDGSKSSLNKINQFNLSVDRSFNQFKERNFTPEMGLTISEMEKQWQQTSQLLSDNLNQFIENSYFDIRMLSDLETQRRTLINKTQSAYQLLANSIQDSGQSSKTLLLCHEGSIAIAQLSAHYSARSSSTVGSPLYSTENIDNIEELIPRFDYIIDELMTKPHSSENTRKLLSEIETRWQFIRQPLTNFNESHISFAVNRYANEIIERLVRISTSIAH